MTKDCRRTISAASNISADESGSISTGMASLALPSKTPTRATWFRCTRMGLLTQGRGLLSYMPDYTVYPEVKQFLGEQESYPGGADATVESSKEYRDFVSDEQLWTNFKLMEVYDQMGQFVCNRYPFNSTNRKNGPSPTLSNVPAPVRPGKNDTILTFNIRDESRATVTPYPFDVDPLTGLISGPASSPSAAMRIKMSFCREYYRAERLAINYPLHSK